MRQIKLYLKPTIAEAVKVALSKKLKREFAVGDLKHMVKEHKITLAMWHSYVRGVYPISAITTLMLIELLGMREFKAHITRV